MSELVDERKRKEPTTEVFDFDSYENERKIPKYKDIIFDINSGKSKFSRQFLAQFSKYEGGIDIVPLTEGKIYTGSVCQIKDREIVVNVSNKDNVIIDRRGSEEKICKQLKLNQEIDVLITKVNENPYVIKGSVADLVRMRVDNKMKDFFENKTAIEAYVKDIIPAGYLLNIDIDNITVDAFMPNTLADVNKLHDINVLLGQKIFVMLETLQQDKGIYVVSRKKYLKTLIPDKIKDLKKYPKDHVFTGHVTGTRNFGIFVQFEDCLTGMIHKANIREDYRDIIEQIEPGTTIDFYIKDIIKGGSQIILTQILKESLWDIVRVGDVINGKVISIKPFGALIELDYETNGLIQTTYLNKSEKKIEEGQIVQVVVISIIRDDRKIYLTFADDDEMIGKLKDKSDEIEKLKQKFNSK
jgi:ribosomal protein S1